MWKGVDFVMVGILGENIILEVCVFVVDDEVNIVELLLVSFKF